MLVKDGLALVRGPPVDVGIQVLPAVRYFPSCAISVAPDAEALLVLRRRDERGIVLVRALEVVLPTLGGVVLLG